MIEATKIAQELKDKLKEYEDFEGLYLYGSQAKGNFKENSDIDILAVFNTDRTYDKSVGAKVYDLDLEYDIIIDFHRTTPAELEADYIYSREVKKGIYYAR